jgi:hypothetical protein
MELSIRNLSKRYANGVQALDGHVGAAEQKAVQAKENRQSKRVFKEKHDAQKGS